MLLWRRWGHCKSVAISVDDRFSLLILLLGNATCDADVCIWHYILIYIAHKQKGRLSTKLASRHNVKASQVDVRDLASWSRKVTSVLRILVEYQLHKCTVTSVAFEINHTSNALIGLLFFPNLEFFVPAIFSSPLIPFLVWKRTVYVNIDLRLLKIFIFYISFFQIRSHSNSVDDGI